MKNMKLFLRRVRNKIILLNRRRANLIRFEIRNCLPHLILNSSYKMKVKFFLRLLGLISFIVSYFVGILNLFLTFLILVLEQLLENVVFIYHDLYIQPLPTDYKPSDWRGMVYGVSLDNSNFKVGLCFDGIDNAKKIFKTIRAWNKNEDLDWEDNINISFVIENDDKYRVYIYPNPFKKEIETIIHKNVKEISEDSIYQLSVMQLILCKYFDYDNSSNFYGFKSKYIEGKSFELGAYILEGTNLIPLENLKPIIKNNLKIKKRSELTFEEDPIEYEHGKFIVLD